MKKQVTSEIILRLNSLTKEIRQYMENEDYNKVNTLQEELNHIKSDYNLFDKPFNENGKVGLKDITGKILVPPIYYDFPETYSYTIKRNSPVVATNENGKCALVTTDGYGTPVTEFKYDMIKYKQYTNYYTCYLNISGKIKKGILSNNGNEVVPCEMDEIYEACNGIIVIAKDNKFGLLTTQGLFISPIYEEITEEDSGLVHVCLDGQWGYISEKGEFISEEDENTLQTVSVLSGLIS